MFPTLFEQFLSEECTSDVVGVLKEVLASDRRYYKFEGNRFDVTIWRERDEVVVDDILDAGDDGTVRMSVSEFAAAISR